MPISSDLSNNRIVTAELVRTVWENYIIRNPTFLNAVTLHVQIVDNPGSAGIFQFIVPNYFSVSVTPNSFDIFPSAYSASEYLSPIQEVEWDDTNMRVHTYSIQQYDQTLLMNNEEYKMNFIESVLIKILLDFEQDFAAKLQGMAIDQINLHWDFSPNLWPTILAILPKTDWSSSQNGNTYEEKAQFWYQSFFGFVLNPSFEEPALGFIPSISDLGGWALETCSQYAKYLNLKNAQLACTPAVMQAICSEYAIASSTSSLIGQWKYNTAGNAIGNGLLNAYSLPSLQIFPDPTGWTQGVIFRITDIDYDPIADIYTVQLTCLTSEANLPSDGGLYISIFTPIILSMRRYSPTVDVIPYSYQIPYNFDLGQWATMNVMEDVAILTGVGLGSVITIQVAGPQLALPYSNKFPLLNTLQHLEVIVSLPWKCHDFNTICNNANFRCTHTGPLSWHPSYLHSKDSTHVFTVKQREVGGGIKSTEEEITDKVPFRIFEQGKVLEGENNITAQGIMAHGIIPQLGGQFLCWGPYLDSIG